jgi:hypothetical protein
LIIEIDVSRVPAIRGEEHHLLDPAPWSLFVSSISAM